MACEASGRLQTSHFVLESQLAKRMCRWSDDQPVGYLETEETRRGSSTRVPLATLLIEVRRPVAARGEDDALAVGRPERRRLVSGMKGEAGGGSARKLEEPDVVGPALEIHARYGNLPLVRGEPEVAMGSQRAHASHASPIPVEPGELGIAHAAAPVSEHAVLRDREGGEAGVDPVVPDRIGDRESFAAQPKSVGPAPVECW